MSSISAEESVYKNLLEKSPFLPKDFKRKASNSIPTVNKKQQQFEFKSMIKINNEWRFSVYEKKSGKSYWIGKEIKSTNADVKLLKFDIAAKEITISSNQKIETLSQKKPSFTPIAHQFQPNPSSISKSSNPSNNSPSKLAPNNQNPKPTNRRPIARRRIIRPNSKNK